MTPPSGSHVSLESPLNAGARGPLRFCGFPNDPGYVDLIMHGHLYKTRMRDRLYGRLGGDHTFVEVGAHIGGTTLHAAEAFRSVLAFEPSESNRACLLYNIAINNMVNITVDAAAVSDHDGRTRLYLYADTNAVGHSLTEAVVRPGAPFADVAVVTLDEALRSVSCTLLHIDAEGHDMRVLSGARNFIRRQKIKPVICVEYAPQMLMRSGSTGHQLVEWCADMGYAAYTDAGNNWAPVSYSTIEELYRIWANTCCGWIDLYLLPIGERLGGMFPEPVM